MKGIRTELPTIEKGIPCPIKTHPAQYKKRASLWHDFLQSLAPGDSFLVLEREVQNLTHIARQMQIKVVVRHGPQPELHIPTDQSRVWLAPAETPDTAPPPPAKKRGISLSKKPAMQVTAIADAADLNLI